ncbi:MAG: leucine-rich repeat protein [Clostridia bacterium]|nr:leucine-rich repeat protein [Clostridia bacterium]
MEDYLEYAILEDDTAEITRYEGSSQTIAIPESLEGYPVTSIGDGAFAGSKSMRFLSIPQTIRSIGSGAFRQCTALQSVIIPQGTQHIGSEAFKDCGMLASVSLPSSLQSLGAEAFRGCRSLKSISIPDGITELADRVLSGCSALTSLSLPGTLTRIGWGAFSKCVALESVGIPQGVEEIGGDAFFSCGSLRHVSLSESLARISDRAFYECTALRHLCVPSGVRSIGSGTFYGCKELTLVTPPDSYAQSYAQSSGIPFAHGSLDGFDYLAFADGTAEILRYDGDAQTIVIPPVIDGHSVCAIGERAFRFLSHVVSVDLPDSITQIGSGAFHGCTSLASLRLPSRLLAIGSDAFKSCSALQSLALPSSVKTLGGYAFYGCTSLEAIQLPGSMNEIGSFTFCGCTALKRVSLPDGLERIGMSAFNGCTSLAELNLPDHLVSIGAKAFKDCRALASLSLDGSICDIGRDAFAGCSSLILHLDSGTCAHRHAAQENLPYVFTHIDAPAPRGVITDKTVFLFPDTPLGELPAQLRIACAKNGRRGVQILFECTQESGSIRVIAPQFDTEIYQMIDVPVEYNTGNGVDQGGAMVLLPDHCPDYAIRKAPFRVYDCLRPVDGAAMPAKDGCVSAYVSFAPKAGLCAGEHMLYIEINSGSAKHVCEITCRISPVSFDEDLFETTNWFSIAAMEQMHHVRRGTPEFNAVVRAYARSMRRVHQKIFLLWMHEDLSERRTQKPYHFDFEDMKPIIEIFFEEGFDTFETGGIICRGYRSDGSQDMYTADFKCSANPSVSVDSAEGYELLCCEMKAFADFLRRNNWQDRVLFHVMDEPDVHYKSDADLKARRVQFFMAANIVRRYLPGVRIIEAVKTTLMRGGVDIMVPITDSYQLNKQAFDDAIAMGDEVFTYVCCAPEGKWLNRFLDQPLINGRLLFWGCALNRITGYLHWGYNQFGGVPNPFEATSARNWTGIGTNFPCGDAFIVYPGENGPWLSMRLEAERQGAQEAAMLRALLMHDPVAHDALITRVFRSFKEYDNTPETLDALHDELLALLEKAETPL